MDKAIEDKKNSGLRSFFMKATIPGTNGSTVIVKCSKWVKVLMSQGILSIPGIASYEWVPARLARFYQNKILFFFILPMAN